MTRKTMLFTLLMAIEGIGVAATLSVAPGQQYATPCAAINAVKDGDTIEIQGGVTYNGDVCVIARNNLTIRGVNGRPKIDAAGKNAKDKGTWVVDGNNITVENVEMYGSRVSDGNGAAFRLEGSGFTLRNAFIHDNQNGILANGVTTSDILIEYSEFGHNGNGDGQTHNLYIGHVKSLTFRYSYSHDANVGHNLKSRAEVNTVVYSRFGSLNNGETGSTAQGKPSYELDFPNAGETYVIGNVIQQPYYSSNPAILAYGEEGATNASQQLYVINNTFINDAGDGPFLFLSAKVNTPSLVQNNIFTGQGQVSTRADTVFKTNYRSGISAVVSREGGDFHPLASGTVINAGSNPGVSSTGVSLVPVGQYKNTAQGEARQIVAALDVGAYEATGAIAVVSAPTWTQCAAENGKCTFSDSREVRFGAADQYTSKVFTGSVTCNAAAFGIDPTKGVVKTCEVAGTAPAPAPSNPTPAPAPATVTLDAAALAAKLNSAFGDILNISIRK